MWHPISWISSINFSIFIFQYMSIYIYIHYLPSYLHLFLFRSKPQVPPVLLAFPHSFRKGLNLTWTRSTLEPWASDSWTQGLRAIQGHWTRETHGTSWNIIPHCCERSWQAVKAIGIHRPLGKDLDESWWIMVNLYMTLIKPKRAASSSDMQQNAADSYIHIFFAEGRQVCGHHKHWANWPIRKRAWWVLKFST